MVTLHLDRLPTKDDQGRVHVVVESPRGARAKMKHDPTSGAFMLDRALPLGMGYPFDWGFVAGTRADDGDPLDAMVIHDISSWPGLVIPSRPLALCRVAQREKVGGDDVENDRIVCVPDIHGHAGSACLGETMKALLQAFFVAVGRQTHAVVEVRGWSDATAAMRAVDDASRGTRLERG